MAVPIPGSPAVAVADANGNATFSFPPPAAGQVFTGTLSVGNAPGSAKFTVLVGGQVQGPSWIGTNGYGPVQTSQGAPLSVAGMGLQPGVQYQCTYLGSLVDGGDLDQVPQAQTSIVQPPNALFLGTGTATHASPLVVDVEVDTSWRSIWVICEDASTAASIFGLQSTLFYLAYTPSYFSNGRFFRFALLAGVDSSVQLTVTPTDAGTFSVWWGADLADVLASVSSTTGDGLALESTLLLLQEHFDSYSLEGGQTVYYDSDTTGHDATGTAIMGTTGIPGGNAKMVLVDANGRLVISPSSGAIAANVTIVGPLDGSGNVKVAIENTPTVNLGQVVGVPGAATPGDAVLVMGSDGTDGRALLTDSGGQLKVLVENTVPVSGAVNATIVGPLDGSGNVKVVIEETLPAFTTTPTFNLGQVVGVPGAATPGDAVLVMGSDGTDGRALLTDSGGQLKVLVENTVPVSGAVNATIVGPLDGSGNVKVVIEETLPAFTTTPTFNLGQVVGVPGAATPGDAVLVMGSDGTDGRALLTDSSSRLQVGLPLVSAAGGAANPTSALMVAGSNGSTARLLPVVASSDPGPTNVLVVGGENFGGTVSQLTFDQDVDGSGNNAGSFYWDLITASRPKLYNGATWDRQRSNFSVAAIASASRSAGGGPYTSAALRTYNARAIYVTVDITSIPTGTLTLTIFGSSGASSFVTSLLIAASVSAAASRVYCIGPGVVEPATGGVVAVSSIPLPYQISISCAVTGTGNIIFGVDVDFAV